MRRFASLVERLFCRLMTKTTTSGSNVLRFRPWLEQYEDRTVPSSTTAQTFDAADPNSTVVAIGTTVDPIALEDAAQEPLGNTGTGEPPTGEDSIAWAAENASETCNAPANNSASIDVPHVFRYDAERETGLEPVFTLSTTIADGQLVIKVVEGKAFAKESTNKGYPFSSVVSGAAKSKDDFHDTDSVQVAVRWSSKTNADVAHATNALPAGTKRDKAADWVFGGKSPTQTATWTTAVPKDATHVEIVIIYTDTIYGIGNTDGDLPLVIGSFSGDLAEDKWTVKTNPDDLFKPQKQQPKKETFADLLAATRKVLENRTGYELKARPEGLAPGVSFTDGATIIDKAVDAKKINDGTDTGFDIVPRK
jgi:hypothetical protein